MHFNFFVGNCRKPLRTTPTNLSGASHADIEVDFIMRECYPTTKTYSILFTMSGLCVVPFACDAKIQPLCGSEDCLPVMLILNSDDQPPEDTASFPISCATQAAPGVHVTGAWANATDVIDVQLSWMLPSGRNVPVHSDGWLKCGLETIDEDSTAIPDGVHWLGVSLPGHGVFADLVYRVSFLNSEFCFSGQTVSPNQYGMAIDVLNGEPTILFNSWVNGNDHMAGGPTGKHAVEFQVGVREATDDVDLQIEMMLPSGANVPGFHMGWGRIGFERVAMERTDVLEEGTYELRAFLNGAGASAEVALDIRFDDVIYHDVKIVGSGWSLVSNIEFSSSGATQSAVVEH